MKKEFLINLLLLVVINLLIKVTYLFFIEVNVQNILGPESYGIFLALFNFSYLLQFINDPGLQSYNITKTAAKESMSSDHLGRMLGLKMMLSIIFILAVIVVSIPVGYHNISIRYLLLWIAANQVLSTGFMFLRSHLSAMGYYRADSLLSVLDKFFMILLIGYLIINYHTSLTLFHFVGGQSVAYLIAISVALLMLRMRGASTWPVFSISYSIIIIKKAVPFALIFFLMSSFNKMDGIMLERLLENGAFQAGIYAASLRFMEAANMGAYLMAALLLPMFASIYRDKAAIGRLSGVAIRTMMVMVMMVCVVGITYRQKLMSIYEVYNEQYERLLIFHLLSFACVAISYVYGTLLTATKRLRSMNYVLFLGFFINLILNLLLIPHYWAIGAAIATLSTQAIVMIGQLALCVRIFNLEIDNKLLISMAIYGILTTGFALIIALNPGIHWLVGVVVLALFISIIPILLGIIRKDMIFALIGKEKLS